MAWHRERPHSFLEAIKAARLLLSASRELVAKGTIETESEQLVIAAYRAVSGKLLSRMELFSKAQDRYPELAGDKLLTLAGARAEGKPLQHLTGVQVFLDHEYEVGPDVLVPRPETEVLVSAAVDELKGHAGPMLGLEIGIGSGAISIELLSKFPRLKMLASELTGVAEKRALSNARRILGESDARARLEIVRAAGPLEVWEPLRSALAGRKADFVISNPPYLAATDPIETEVRDHEPATALFAPESDSLHFYREIALNAGQYLAPGGKVFAELPTERALQIQQLFSDIGWQTRLHQDLTLRDRVLIASFLGKR